MDQVQPLPGWQFDPLNWLLAAPSGVEVELTTAEYCVVSAFAETPGISVSSDQLMLALGKAAAETNRRSLDSTLSRLRKKIEGRTGMPLPVKAVRSIGYVFAAPLTRR